MDRQSEVTTPHTPDDEAAAPEQPSDAPSARPPRLALRASVAGVILVLGGGIVAAVLGSVLERMTGRPGFTDLFVLLANGVAYVCAGVLAIVSVGRRPSEYVPRALPSARAWIAGPLLGLGTFLLVFSAAARLYSADSGYVEMMEEMLARLDALLTPWGALVLLGVLIPICEELLFRGVILRSLLDRWGAWPAILVSALIFGAFHLHPVHGLIAFLLGIAAGWAMVATGSVLTAIAVHVTNNFLGLGVSIVYPDLEGAPLWVLAPAFAVLAGAVALLRRPLGSVSGASEPAP